MAEGYRLEYTPRAGDQLERLTHKITVKIVRKLRWLAANVPDLKHDAMTGNWAGFFRIRIGDYRAIYSLDHANRIIEIESVGHRRDVYNK